ncbi:MAG: hypothetical protein ACI8RZ_003529 [Myxococcota bacterium]|jgi:hypothetical protein
MILLLLLGCSDAPADTATTAPACDPIDVSLIGDWQESDLRSDHKRRHTEPGIAIGDLDGDGWTDALVAWGGGSFVLHNDGTGKLEVDNTWTANDAPLPPATAVALADLDGDGDLDAYLGRSDGEPDVLLYNDGDRFRATLLSGADIASWTGAFADADGDGDLDLAVAGRVLDIQPEPVLSGEQIGKPNLLYIQDGGVFTESPERIPQEDNYGLTFQVVWLDIDGDGDLDLYEVNDWGFNVVPNRLLLNDGTGHFTEAEDCSCDLPMYGMGAAIGDLVPDGIPDLYITDIGSPKLLVNLGDGTFYDGTLAHGADNDPTLGSVTSWGATATDLNLDGCADLMVTFGGLNSYQVDAWWGSMTGVNPEWRDETDQVDVIFQGDCAGGFTRLEDLRFSEHAGRGRSLAVGDFNADGRPELLMAGKYYVQHWEVTGGCEQSLTLHFSSDDIGARIEATVDGRQSTQWLLPSTTHSQSALSVMLGLGEAQEASEVTITWPDGTQQSHTDLAAGSTHTITR